MPMSKIHPKYKEFDISEEGIITNISTKKVRMQTIDQTGYYVLSIRRNGKSSKYYIHRLIAETYLPNPYNLKYIDHIDGNKLNNSLSNLRWCTQSQNLMNARKRSNTASQYKGLYWHNQNKKWVVRVRKSDGTKVFAYHVNEKEAARLYNKLAIEHYGEYANLNIIK